MSLTVTLNWFARLCGLVLVVLGLLFWNGQAFVLLPLHMVLGLLLVLALWGLALLARRSAPAGLLTLIWLWGLAVPLLGLTQTRLLPGSLHVLIQLLHLLLGLGAIGLAETLTRRMRQGAVHHNRAA